MVAASLKKNCLGFPELLAQAIALISPTMTAALIIPVMYSNTGDWSWLSYALGTVMLLFVALNLNQFARRSTSSGSMYAYVSRGLGLTAGGIGGWSLIWAYLGISMAGVTGFTIFAGKLLGDDRNQRSSRSLCSRSASAAPGSVRGRTFASRPC